MTVPPNEALQRTGAIRFSFMSPWFCYVGFGRTRCQRRSLSSFSLDGVRAR